MSIHDRAERLVTDLHGGTVARVLSGIAERVRGLSPAETRDVMVGGLLALTMGSGVAAQTPEGLATSVMLAGAVGAGRLTLLMRTLRTDVEERTSQVASLKAENAALRALVASGTAPDDGPDPAEIRPAP